MSANGTNCAVLESGCVLIHRHPRIVFRFIAEEFFANYRRWSPEVIELRQIGSGPVGVGTRARQVRVDLGHRSESVFIVTVCQPDRCICFEAASGEYRCRYTIEEVASQPAALLHFGFELPTLRLIWRPFETFVREAVRTGVDRTVRNVKQLVEADVLEQAA